MTPRVRVTTAVVWLVFASFLVACSGGKRRPMTMEEMIAADPLPLSKGSKWTYDVIVKRYDADTNQVATKQLTWVTEVIGAEAGRGITAYHIKGWLTDLADFDQAPVASDRTLLRAGNNFMWGKTTAPDLDGAEGWFTWPVIDGQKICPSQAVVYCWQVSSIPNGYALSFFTGPDEQTFDLEPGTGVSHFHYAHHGTTNEVDAKLVSYTSGKL